MDSCHLEEYNLIFYITKIKTELLKQNNVNFNKSIYFKLEQVKLIHWDNEKKFTTVEFRLSQLGQCSKIFLQANRSW